MRLSDLQTKSIVCVNDGKNIGNIIDANVTSDGTIESLVIEANKTFFSLNRESDTEINWKDITKIGEDVILVISPAVFSKLWQIVSSVHSQLSLSQVQLIVIDSNSQQASSLLLCLQVSTSHLIFLLVFFFAIW